ncbi:hypothetical protein FN846DRAFT_979611 [Sphaerosporella brunnea]|uniref:Uncharacterized protein n=1 Tax=Sphaerosporella brunnea TaxID=1250544 RepID=A0A5J5ECN5_9PEZI|nr:hypothetical protein FN846DRAFT_979611 [Sphaerosporella brunnea]
MFPFFLPPATSNRVSIRRQALRLRKNELLCSLVFVSLLRQAAMGWSVPLLHPPPPPVYAQRTLAQIEWAMHLARAFFFPPTVAAQRTTSKQAISWHRGASALALPRPRHVLGCSSLDAPTPRTMRTHGGRTRVADSQSRRRQSAIGHRL